MIQNLDMLNQSVRELRNVVAMKHHNLFEVCRCLLHISRHFLDDDASINKIARSINIILPKAKKTPLPNENFLDDADIRGFINLFKMVEKDYRINDLPKRLQTVDRLQDKMLIEPLKNFLKSLDRYESMVSVLELDESTVLVGLFLHHVVLVNALVRGQNLPASYGAVADGLHFLPAHHPNRKFFLVQYIVFQPTLIDFFLSHQESVKNLLLYYLSLKPLGSNKFLDDYRAELERLLLKLDLPDIDSLIDAGFLLDRTSFNQAPRCLTSPFL